MGRRTIFLCMRVEERAFREMTLNLVQKTTIIEKKVTG